jgi:hypothetical protein
MACPHKHKILACGKCGERVCARCVPLDAHGCSQMAAAAIKERVALATKLVKVVAPKVAAFQ